MGWRANVYGEERSCRPAICSEWFEVKGGASQYKNFSVSLHTFRTLFSVRLSQVSCRVRPEYEHERAKTQGRASIRLWILTASTTTMAINFSITSHEWQVTKARFNFWMLEQKRSQRHIHVHQNTPRKLKHTSARKLSYGAGSGCWWFNSCNNGPQ
jgi:hypothetical protein